MKDSMIKPLQGITVVDLSRALAGPYCTALLADMGAKVIKVESINGGDTARQWPPFQDDHSLYFDSVNRNKESICLDFYSPAGQEIIQKLVTKADVLVENFKPGTLKKMGLTEERLEQLNPDLIVASVSGFGNAGPLKDNAGLDQVIQGMSGLMSVTGSDEDHTFRVGVPIVDITSGMICAFGIASALVGRRGDQQIKQVSTSLLETALNLSVFQGQRALSQDEAPTPQGNNHPVITPYGMYKTATDPITVAVGNDRQWQDFCKILGIPGALEDPRFLNGRERSANREQLTELIEDRLSTREAEQWVALISQAGIPCGPIYNYKQAFATEQVTALNLVHDMKRQDGSSLPLLRGPLSLNDQPSEVCSPPPLLGQHTADVLRELGFSKDQIDRLQEDGVLKTPHQLQTAGAK
jgi:CoA:oxalate CoA-transferase